MMTTMAMKMMMNIIINNDNNLYSKRMQTESKNNEITVP